MSDQQIKRWLLRAGAAVFAILLFYAAVRWLLLWLLPFILAALLAAAIEPAVRGMQKKLRLRRWFCSLVLTLFLIFVLGGLLSLLCSALVGEAYSLLRQLPVLFDAAGAAFSSLAERLGEAAAPAWLRERLTELLEQSELQTEKILAELASSLPSLLAAIAAALPKILLSSATCVLAIYFTSSSLPEIRKIMGRTFSQKQLGALRGFRTEMSLCAAHWLRAELTLCAVTFAQLLLGFAVMREPYALLLAFAVTLVDALPVFGTGTVLVPWAAAELILQNIPKSIALIALYLLTLLVRSVLEPRLLSAQSGLPPIASLAAMYLGFCTLGVGGMLLFPFLLMCFAQLNRQIDSEKLSITAKPPADG